MNAQRVAARLKAIGIPVREWEEGTESEDGSVTITESVHVQVPTFGGGLCIVKESRGPGGEFDLEWEHYPIRRTVAELMPDYKKAIGL